ncbi:MAG: VWA domain-containing protein, partial [Candidatus Acidiferrum sp.]
MTKRTFFHLSLFLTSVLAVSAALQKSATAQAPAPAVAPSSSTAADTSTPTTLRFLAVDRGGNPVTDLQAQDLSVTVNGKPRKVVSLTSAVSAPVGIGLFFDISGSRREDQLISKEVQTTSKFLESIWHPDDVAFVIAFGEIPVTLANPTSDLQQIESALQKIPDATYRGSTAVYDALCSVHISPQQIARGENLFIVVSDFQDNSSHISADKMIQMLQGEKIRIFPLLRLEEDERRVNNTRHLGKIARKIAEKTGGDVLVVSSEKDLDNVLHRLHGELQGAYLLTYEPLPQEGKAEEQQIRT